MFLVHAFISPQGCPLCFDVTDHNPPSVSFGCRGTKDKGFLQPCNVAVVSPDNAVFVVYTGNSRIKRLTPNLDFDGHVYNPALEGRSVTGICAGASGDTILVINWRTRTVTEMALDGATVSSFTHADLREPIDIALDATGDKVLVADNELGLLLVFDPAGKLLSALGPKGKVKLTPLPNEDEEGHDFASLPKAQRFKDLSAVCVAPNGEYVAADSTIFVFDPTTGAVAREISVPSSAIAGSIGGPGGSGAAKGRFGGLACDENGFLLATHSIKKQSFIQVRYLHWKEIVRVLIVHMAHGVDATN